MDLAAPDVDGVLFVLRTGCQWKAVPREFGSGSTVHRRFQRWTDEGRWEAMWRLLLQFAEATQQLEWVWQSADASLHKAPLDKGYDYADAERAVHRRRYVPHIRRRGEERRRCRRGERARRWVVERTHSWFNRFRKLLIRWEKRPQNHLALVQFAAMLIVWRLVG